MLRPGLEEKKDELEHHHYHCDYASCSVINKIWILLFCALPLHRRRLVAVARLAVDVRLVFNARLPVDVRLSIGGSV